jgi:hypothetical protein
MSRGGRSVDASGQITDNVRYRDEAAAEPARSCIGVIDRYRESLVRPACEQQYFSH